MNYPVPDVGRRRKRRKTIGASFFRDRTWTRAVVAGSLLTAATAPGQTAALSPFTDPLIAQLGISRTDISLSYLIGTLAGAVALPFIGRALDRWGARKVILVVAGVFAAALFSMSFVTGIVGLTVGFVFLRMTGQGALTLAATTAVVRAVTTGRGLALGITTAVGSAGISLTPVVVDRLITTGGLGFAWRLEAAAVLVVVLPMILVLPKHRPVPAPAKSAQGQPPDGDLTDWSTGQAVRTPIFWAIAAALAATGMLTTGLAFHQISILTAQGLTSTQAAANFIPQTVTGILATLTIGAVSHRLDPRIVLAASMVLMAAALGLLPLVHGVPTALTYGFVIGAASGAIRAIEPIALAHYFGTVSIGGIRGMITAINVGSTALGPILFSLGRDLAGNYAEPALILAILPLAVVAFALMCPTPGRSTVS